MHAWVRFSGQSEVGPYASSTSCDGFREFAFFRFQVFTVGFSIPRSDASGDDHDRVVGRDF